MDGLDVLRLLLLALVIDLAGVAHPRLDDLELLVEVRERLVEGGGELVPGTVGGALPGALKVRDGRAELAQVAVEGLDGRAEVRAVLIDRVVRDRYFVVIGLLLWIG